MMLSVVEMWPEKTWALDGRSSRSVPSAPSIAKNRSLSGPRPAPTSASSQVMRVHFATRAAAASARRSSSTPSTSAPTTVRSRPNHCQGSIPRNAVEKRNEGNSSPSSTGPYFAYNGSMERTVVSLNTHTRPPPDTGTRLNRMG